MSYSKSVFVEVAGEPYHKNFTPWAGWLYVKPLSENNRCAFVIRPGSSELVPVRARLGLVLNVARVALF